MIERSILAIIFYISRIAYFSTNEPVIQAVSRIIYPAIKTKASISTWSSFRNRQHYSKRFTSVSTTSLTSCLAKSSTKTHLSSHVIALLNLTIESG
uniref:AlNc14C47G3808 protein n=1 Tax=Albugo laibachii Nc14 TaxID=890382 RepID=F0WAU6_9STRA|nr:AlNc14C47G3808 [Albugo laibachii Nc14]|eukprot:CCA18268.1 AlNc14C47G3808 [Albugo laibachii Nc14]